MIYVKVKQIKDEDVIMFFEDNRLIGCIKDHRDENDYDFSFLFKYLKNLNWQLEVFENFEFNYENDRFEDWLDSYENYKYTYKFKQFDKKYEVFYDDYGNGSYGMTLEEFFNFINSNCIKKFKVIK